ncbi:MAG: YcxB family protein [Bacteroidales bacterium]|nr:YcxB family protein [Bacteroidales bacterium]MDD4213242.1 YcxB family protein [Bacteroidales bacterium]
MEKIEKNILFTPEDLQLAYTTHFRRTYPVRSRMLFIISIISLLTGIAFFCYDFSQGNIFIKNWAAWFLLCYGITIAVVYFHNLKTIGKRMYSKMPDFERPYNFIFDAGKIQITSETTNNINKWEAYNSALFCENMILLYPNKLRFNLFPKKYFTDEEFNMLKQWIKAKIKTKEYK